MTASAPVFVIAEAGVNHNGSLDMALRLVDEAAAAGADAVKFQSFRSNLLATPDARKANYQIRASDGSQGQREMLAMLELDTLAHRTLVHRCEERRIEFMSSPFDEASVDLLAVEIGVRRIKIASGELTNAPLLLKIGRTGLPFLLSTGMSDLNEITEALGILAFGGVGSGQPSPAAFRDAWRSDCGRRSLAGRATLLHCTSEYPAPPQEINLRAMDTLGSAFALPVGLSDHSLGIAVAVAAVARGATVIEKHLTLDRALPGPDHAVSLQPDEFAEMVRAIRVVELALGSPEKRPTESELLNVPIVRRSLVALTAIKRGEAFTAENIGSKRPGGGMSPLLYWQILGERAPRDFAPDEPIEL
jgi:N-acetylneuraminate synthase